MTYFPASYEAVPAGAQWRHRHQPQPVRHQVRPGAEADNDDDDDVYDDDQVLKLVSAKKNEFIIIDTPGQIEAGENILKIAYESQ